MKATLILLMACLLLAVPLLAQTVEVSNALVFYFDEEATIRSWYGTGEVTVYLVAGPMENNGQAFQLLNSWSFWEMLVMPFENVSSATLTMRGNANPAMVPVETFIDYLAVELLEPLPLDGRTVVAELALNVVSDEPTQLWVWGAECMVDGTPWGFTTLTSGPDGPMDMTGHTANINDVAPVGTQNVSWGQVKALYR